MTDGEGSGQIDQSGAQTENERPGELWLAPIMSWWLFDRR